jgi:hypothetical protein
VSAAAVSKAGDVADQDLASAELVAVRAAHRRVSDPLPGRSLHELAQHSYQRNSGVSVLYD